MNQKYLPPHKRNGALPPTVTGIPKTFCAEYLQGTCTRESVGKRCGSSHEGTVLSFACGFERANGACDWGDDCTRHHTALQPECTDAEVTTFLTALQAQVCHLCAEPTYVNDGAAVKGVIVVGCPLLYSGDDVPTCASCVEKWRAKLRLDGDTLRKCPNACGASMAAMIAVWRVPPTCEARNRYATGIFEKLEFNQRCKWGSEADCWVQKELKCCPYEHADSQSTGDDHASVSDSVDIYNATMRAIHWNPRRFPATYDDDDDDGLNLEFM